MYDTFNYVYQMYYIIFIVQTPSCLDVNFMITYDNLIEYILNLLDKYNSINLITIYITIKKYSFFKESI